MFNLTSTFKLICGMALVAAIAVGSAGAAWAAYQSPDTCPWQVAFSPLSPLSFHGLDTCPPLALFGPHKLETGISSGLPLVQPQQDAILWGIYRFFTADTSSTQPAQLAWGWQHIIDILV